MNFFGNGQSLPQYGSVSNQGLDSPAQRLELPTAIGGGGQISSKGASRAFVVCEYSAIYVDVDSL
jgi:hypothetical protein